MSCATIYDFITGTVIDLPMMPQSAAETPEDGRHGVRPILNPTADAWSLLQEHVRLLSELRGTAASV